MTRLVQVGFLQELHCVVHIQVSADAESVGNPLYACRVKYD